MMEMELVTSPLGRAQEMLRNIINVSEGKGVPLPARRYTEFQNPQPVVESVIVGVAAVNPYADLTGRLGMERCAPPMSATIRGTICRDWICVDDEGIDDPQKVMAASLRMQDDADTLWECIWMTEPYLGPLQVTIDSQITGGLVAVTGVFTIGIH